VLRTSNWLDPASPKRLEEAGCATVMPLGLTDRSGPGIRKRQYSPWIIESPGFVVVDGGQSAGSSESGPRPWGGWLPMPCWINKRHFAWPGDPCRDGLRPWPWPQRLYGRDRLGGGCALLLRQEGRASSPFKGLVGRGGGRA